MGTPKTSIMLFVTAALLGAVGQYLYKSGADRTTAAVATYILNWRIAAGVLCYIAVMVFFVMGFKKGGSLAVLYPVYASTFIWAAIIAWIAYDVPIRPVNVLGMGLLVAGMFLMGK